MAWELGNEPRCGADAVRNLPRSLNCTTDTITKWIDEMSTYIKSLDKDHLVTWGGEGGFNIASSDWAYNGSDGGDFDAEIALPNIDFGVFHSYPDWWSKPVATAARKAKKPVVHEEYGWLTNDKRKEYLGTSSNRTRTEVLGLWHQASLKEKMSDMYWQFGYSAYSYKRNHDDGFTIFLEDEEAKKLVYEHAAAVNKLN
jgi:mannan endo-1,4-beta-mannosidase